MTASISLSRVQNSKLHEYVELRIDAEDTHVTVKLSMEDFALLITGRYLYNIDVELVQSIPVIYNPQINKMFQKEID